MWREKKMKTFDLDEEKKMCDSQWHSIMQKTKWIIVNYGRNYIFKFPMQFRTQRIAFKTFSAAPLAFTQLIFSLSIMAECNRDETDNLSLFTL